MSASSEPVRVAVSPQRVKPLPETFTRNRYQFDQFCRTDNTAIYVRAKYDLLKGPAFKTTAPPLEATRARLGFAQDALETAASINTAGDER